VTTDVRERDVETALAGIDARRDELVSLTQDLVRIPTVNPPGDNYRACAEFLGERLRKRGFEVTYVRAEGAPGDTDALPRINVIARREGARPGPCVHFNSHIDVVAPGEGWTVDPFGGVVKDGRVYGRGTCDMKGGLAASVIAVEALLKGGADPHLAPLVVAAPGRRVPRSVDRETPPYRFRNRPGRSCKGTRCPSNSPSAH